MPVSISDLESRRIRVSGLVQGVGFRPAVWRLAKEEGLTGFVLNDGAGVAIEVTGAPAALDRFCQRLDVESPPLARIDRIEAMLLDQPATQADSFVIRTSEKGSIATGIVPDAATCPDCLAECRNPADRRHGYAFTNCTHCGPRLSIVEAIPYDRQTTTMAHFNMCPACQQEYDDPGDRRFHAQPNACPECGPRLWLEDRSGNRIKADPFAAAARSIADGGIVAVKGIGGFHLACDATSDAAVRTLRQRKARDHKPLAVMVRDIQMARALAEVDGASVELLESAAAPILLLEKRADAGLAAALALEHRRIGIMLPYSPLHHLLLAELARPLVMTSGNRSSEPQCIDNDDARERLADIADAWLMHDREIANRLDDSVVRVDSHGPTILRRARGMAPEPIRLAPGFALLPSVLAFGGELKSTFCLARRGEATLSQHLGDLEEPGTCADFRKTLDLYRRLYAFAPDVIAVDKHPDYAPTVWGKALAEQMTVPIVRVQHHHAHLTAVMAENGCDQEQDRVLGIILDGTGLGEDGTIWGGEFLLGGYRQFERVGHLETIALPGGAAAVREPWRNTYAHLRAAHVSAPGTIDFSRRDLAWLREKPVAVIDMMLEQRINAPMASSAGRLFDAVAGALGICRELQGYEGQAAMEMETLAAPLMASAGPYPFAAGDGSPSIVSFAPMWPALLADLERNASAGLVAARFHHTLIAAIVTTTKKLARRHDVDAAALSGGVFQNQILLDGVGKELERLGLRVLRHRRVPANDGGLALGQASIAAATVSNWATGSEPF